MRNLRFSIRRSLFSVYARIKYHVHIWRLLNRKAVRAHQTHPPILSDVQKRIVSDLRTEGISVCSLNDLFPTHDYLPELLQYVEKRENRGHVNKKKPFLEDLIPQIPELGPEIPFFNIATNPVVVDIVNSYMGMHSVLYHFLLRKTKLSGRSLPWHSQNWHRAPQEKMNCRMYIYLSDVDESSGPFMYVPKSTFNKKWGHIARQEAVHSPYVTAEVIESKIPADERMTVTGPAGTVIFCDSTGLHRGGYSTDKTRVMSTFGYGAPTLRENIHYSYTDSTLEKMYEMPKQSRDVLNKKWKRAAAQ